MWDIIIAPVFVYPVVEIAEEWRRRRAANRLLAEMRKHAQHQHRWDAVLGRWVRELFGFEACHRKPKSRGLRHAERSAQCRP